MLSKIHQDTLIGIFIIIFSILFFIPTFNMTNQAAIFPQGILIVFSLFGIFILIGGAKKSSKLHNYEKEELYPEGEEDKLSWKTLRSPLIGLIIIFGYVFLINILGFFITTVVFMLTLMWYMGAKKWTTYVYTILGFTLFIYFLFVVQLNVSLPQGILF